MIASLVKERIVVNADEAYNMNFIEFMNWLCYFRDKETYIKELEEKNSNTITT